MALALLLPVCVCAQTDRKEVRKGNREYRRNDFKHSEIDYRKALVKDSTSFAANYNLASSLYRQKNYEGAAAALDKLKEQAPGSAYAADYYFNSGNTALQKSDYASAVESFRQALLLRPEDEQAKESYIYAKKMLKNQQDNKQNQQNNQNKDNKDQDKQDQDKKDNQQDKQDQQQNQPQDRRNDQGQQPQPKISPQQGQQILQAMQAKEKDTQDKVKKEKASVYSKEREKNW